MKENIWIILLVSFCSYGQLELDAVDNKYSFIKIDSTNLNKKDLYNSTKIWFAKTFTDSKSVISLENEEQIIGKGNFSIDYISSGYPISSIVDFTISVYFKDKKYKFQMESFVLRIENIEVDLEDYQPTNSFESFKKRLKKQIEGMAESEQKTMNRYYRNEKSLKKAFNLSLEVSKSVLVSSNNKVKNIYNSYKKSINTKKDDW